MAGVTQQMQGMSVGGGQPQPAGQQMRLNPLQPVDIGPQGSPFHVTDLDQSPSPYLYILNLRVGSMAEAKRRLKAHLALNGGTLASGQELPQKGKVKLLPHPTWDGTADMDSY